MTSLGEVTVKSEEMQAIYLDTVVVIKWSLKSEETERKEA